MRSGCLSSQVSRTAYQPKQSGSMLPEPETQQPIGGVKIGSGEWRTVVAVAVVVSGAKRRHRWVHLNQTRLACTIRPATYGSGWRNAGMTTIVVRPPMDRHGQAAAIA